MILAALLLITALASAQTNDARALLEDIASSARATKSWTAEGVEIQELSGNGIQLRDEIRFKIAIQGPSKMRWETSGDDDTLMVCDGTDHWTYYQHALSFYRNSVGVSPCKPGLGDYSQVMDNLTAAIVIGRDQIQFAGGPRECDLVRAEYTVPGSPDGGVATRSSVHTMCIDAARQLILRDSGESTGSGMRSTGTITYTFYEREPKLSPEVFEFQVSTGIVEDEGPQVGVDDPILEAGVYRMGPHVSGPMLVYKVEPSYTEDARQARVSGMVLVSLAVDSRGKPLDVTVLKGLGHGLDEKAIEAVAQWRYRPGMKDGVAVTVGISMAVVNIRLPYRWSRSIALKRNRESETIKCMKVSVPSVFDLSPAEKLQLVEDLWDDLAATPDEVPIHDWQIKELARRKANLQRNPNSVTDWESVKRRVRGLNGR